MPSFSSHPTHYQVLGLDPPTQLLNPNPNPTSSSPTDLFDPSTLRKAYRTALLRAHPDKSSTIAIAKSNSHQPPTQGRPERSQFFSIDAIKEAFAVLNNKQRRAEYDVQLRTTHTASNRGSRGEAEEEEGESRAYNDFILGLEILDLTDFEEIAVAHYQQQRQGGPTSTSPSPSPSPSSTSTSSKDGNGNEDIVEWIRPCRCGAEKGFSITEEELEGAVERGEKEVLVGCEGCSLWVRVGFEVEGEGPEG